MIIHELTPDDCRRVLARSRWGRLACARSDQPYVMPFSFAFDALADCLYSVSTVGQKIDWMRGNPKVCVEVDDIVDQFTWTSVVAMGLYREVGDSASDAPFRRRASELFQQHATWWLPGLGRLASGEERHSPVVYRIVLDQVTGRRAAGADSEIT